MSTPDTTETNTTVLAANAAADAGVRPIDLPHASPAGPGSKSAPERGVYADRNGVHRIVGRGDVIPEGWDKVESAGPAAIEDRGARTETTRDDATRAAAGNRAGQKGKRGPAEDKSAQQGDDKAKAAAAAKAKADADAAAKADAAK